MRASLADLVGEVIPNVRGQGAPCVRLAVDARQQPVVHRPQKVEAGNFRPCQRKHLESPGPSPQEVHSGPADLPGTRSAQDEGDASGFDQTVYFVEQAGDFLDFVDDDGLRPPRRFRVRLAAADSRQWRTGLLGHIMNGRHSPARSTLHHEESGK